LEFRNKIAASQCLAENRPSPAGPSISGSYMEVDYCTNGSEWHKNFNIPNLNNFSPHVRNSVSSGVVTVKCVQILQCVG